MRGAHRWALPTSWLKEVPSEGRLYFEFSSSEEQGCRPHWATRREVLDTVWLAVHRKEAALAQVPEEEAE